MKKIRLDVDKLEISSFSTQEAMDEPRGTVRGHLTNGAWTCAYHCTWDHVTCNGEATCGQQATSTCTENVSCLC